MAQAKKTAKAAIVKSKISKVKSENKDNGIIQETSRDQSQTATKEVAVGEVASQQSPVANENMEIEDLEQETAADKPLAKAGKRSEKALKEVAEKVAKEERKAGKAEAESAEVKKPTAKKVRSKLERTGKKFREVAKLVEKDKLYGTKEALELAIKTSTVKFDATVELHINLGVDPRQADQNVRDNLVLPAGTGKVVRIAVLADGDDIATAKKAGADLAGSDEIFAALDKGIISFDTLIATPAMMPKLGKYARVLGPKGLMPNPKSGTVTPDVKKAVEQAKAGRVEYRVDSTGIVHLGVGKVSFGADKLMENVQAVFASVKGNKPASIKSIYVKSITMTTTMGPGIKVSASEI